MKAQYHNIEQNTEQWEQLRVGRVGASAFNNLTMSETATGFQKTIARVAQEQVTGVKTESYKDAAMEAGHEIEPEAREAYEVHTLTPVTNGGYYTYKDLWGCSPDGHAGSGIIEIKSLQYNTWQAFLMSGKIPKQYYWQVQFQLFLSGAAWCDFVVYQRGFKPIIIRELLKEKEAITEIMAKAEVKIKERIELLKEWRQS